MQTKHLRFGISGFTLIEIIIVVSILAILATVVGINYSDSSRKARDAERQADLRSLQNAIELYKNRVGRYPAQCPQAAPVAAEGWSGQLGTNYACSDGTGQYIVGLAPTYINVLPVDPKLNGVNSGYVYRTNAAGTVYKLMAMNTVEGERVSYTHPMMSCDLIPDGFGNLQFTSNVDVAGWCAFVNGEATNPPLRCRKVSDAGDGRFESSYGVWGGFADLFGLPILATSTRVQHTTAVICK